KTQAEDCIQEIFGRRDSSHGIEAAPARDGGHKRQRVIAPSQQSVLCCARSAEKEMTPNRKQVAEALKDEIQRLGGFVISPPGDIERIRFQFLIPCAQELHKLSELGFDPTFRNAGLRFHHDTAVPCHTYEVVLPVERQVPVQDRTIYGEVVDRT